MSARLAPLLALVLAGRLALAPFAAADDTVPTPIRDAAARAATQAATAPRRGSIPGGLKWTGVGLLSGSLLPVVIAHFGDCVSDEFSCRDQRTAAHVAGGVMAGTGALLLVIGHHKRPLRDSRLPAVTFTAGRAAVVQRITF
jgi:hypothetical protein